MSSRFFPNGGNGGSQEPYRPKSGDVLALFKAGLVELSVENNAEYIRVTPKGSEVIDKRDGPRRPDI